MRSSRTRVASRILAATFFFAALAVGGVARADEPKPDAPKRQGFTLELGLGPAYTHVFGNETRYGDGGAGLSGLSLSLGGYVSPDVAIVVRAAGTSFWTSDGNKQQIVNGVYGVSTIGWIGDFYLGGGAGVARYGNSYASSSQYLTGLGLDLRAGYSFDDGPHHAFTIGVEATPAFYDGVTVVGTGVNLEWHYF
jgi:hypothetical protein